MSFIPTLATMILGLIAGGVLRSERTRARKMLWLVCGRRPRTCRRLAARLARTVPGRQTHLDAELDVVQRRLVFPAAGGFLSVIDIWGWRAWAFPLVVIGLNSIAAYCIAHLFEGFIHSSFETHLGADAFKILGPAYETLFSGGCMLLVYWLILFWMYRQQVVLEDLRQSS